MVAIKNMDYPSDCSACPFWYVGYTNEGKKTRYCVPTEKTWEKGYKKPDWCPLVEMEEEVK